MEGVDYGVEVYISERLVGVTAGCARIPIFTGAGWFGGGRKAVRNNNERVASYANDAQQIQTARIPACSRIALCSSFQ